MPRSSGSNLNAFLAIDKPAGWSSHDIVARVRKLTGVRRVGHAGTLDPFATGLLVVGVGRATRLIQYVQKADKTYQATLKLGEETDTLDTEGTTVARAELTKWPERARVDDVVNRFVGTYEQVPPAHSAIHVGGKRAYERARSGERVDIPARTVTVSSIIINSYEPPDLSLTVTCGTGTYIRSLARDIGRELGTLAYCSALRRTAIGRFSINDAINIEDVTSDCLRQQWDDIVIPPDAAVAHFDAVSLTKRQSIAWYHGQSLPDMPGTPGSDDTSLVRVYSADGNFAGLGTYDEHGLRPVLVFMTG